MQLNVGCQYRSPMARFRSAWMGVMENLLQVRDLTVRYHPARGHELPAVAGVNFDIAPGEVVGLMGESGCGKTSIAMALLGLLPPDRAAVSGSVRLHGQELLAMKEDGLEKIRGAGISMVHQEPAIALNPVMPVGDQIAEVIHAHRNWSWKCCRAEAGLLIAQAGLPHTDRIYSSYPHQLSGGQRQRVLLAQALACKPQLVIADEPTAALDACNQAGFLALLRQLKQQQQISFLLISHTAEIQASLADRLLVMSEGRIVEQGRFKQLYASPSHPCTKAMLRRNCVSDTKGAFESEMVTEEVLIS
jgi:ABC-type glutathione transport system ATPase component